MITRATIRRLIARKRDGETIERESLLALIRSYMSGIVEDAQMAAFLMACVLRGLNEAETAALTEAFVASGESLNIDLDAPVVDKHSSGGVADTTSLIVVPLVAECGVRVAKLAGRALGHTGGTLDKLEAVPGVRTDLDPARFLAQLRETGCVIAAQSDRFVPADKRIYALRDATATVPSIGLIAASIVSKKIAGGADAIVYDVKVGNGAFMRTPEQARELACLMVRSTRSFGKKAYALVTDMNEPLGSSIGTTLEVIEARDFLRGTRRDARLQTVCVALARTMLRLAEHPDPDGAIAPVLQSGAGYMRLERMLGAQGAQPGALDALTPFPQFRVLEATRSGFIHLIDAPALGEAARDLEERDGSAAGINTLARTNAFVREGDPLAIVHGTPEQDEAIRAAFTITEEPPAPRSLLYLEVDGNDP
jgi:pyrimidine-nucleoside phosphorylase